jgi:hypothetical protein
MTVLSFFPVRKLINSFVSWTGSGPKSSRSMPLHDNCITTAIPSAANGEAQLFHTLCNAPQQPINAAEANNLLDLL